MSQSKKRFVLDRGELVPAHSLYWGDYCSYNGEHFIRSSHSGKFVNLESGVLRDLVSEDAYVLVCDVDIKLDPVRK